MASYTPKLKEILRAHGCSFERPGRGDHEIWYSPITGRRFPVDHAISIPPHRQRSFEASRHPQTILTIDGLQSVFFEFCGSVKVQRAEVEPKAWLT